MPTVPALEPRATLAPLPTVRLNPNAPVEAFGGGKTLPDLTGAVVAADSIGREQARVALEEKNKADAAAVDDAGAKYTDYLTNRLHGTPDADGYTGDPGILSKHGQNVFGEPEKFQTEAQSVAGVMRNSLANDDQRLAFDQRVRHEYSTAWEQIQRHVATERQKYMDETAQGAIDAQNNKAIQSYDDPTVVEPAIAAGAAIIQGHAQRNGLPPDFAEKQIAKNTSAIRTSVIKSMVDNGQDLAAKQYFTDHKADFVGADFLNAEKMWKAGSLEGEAMRQADAIVQSTPNENDAYTKAAAITDPLVRQKAEQRIQYYFNRQATATRQAQQSAYDQGYQTLRNNAWDLSKVPLSVRNSMGAAHDETLVRMSEQQQKLARNGGEGDPEAFMTLQNEAYFDPETFAARNILSTPGLNQKEQNRLLALQRTTGLRVQRQDESSIVAGMKATEKAIKAGDIPAPDTTGAGALSNDPALSAALSGGRARVPAAAVHGGLVVPGRPAPSVAPSAPPAAAPNPDNTPGNVDFGGGAAVPATAPSGNIVGLSPAAGAHPHPIPITASMQRDIVQYGEKYADFLRHSGVVGVPDDVPAFIAAEQAKASAATAKPGDGKQKPKALKITRDSGGGMIVRPMEE